MLLQNVLSICFRPSRHRAWLAAHGSQNEGGPIPWTSMLSCWFCYVFVFCVSASFQSPLRNVCQQSSNNLKIYANIRWIIHSRSIKSKAWGCPRGEMFNCFKHGDRSKYFQHAGWHEAVMDATPNKSPNAPCLFQSLDWLWWHPICRIPYRLLWHDFRPIRFYIAPCVNISENLTQSHWLSNYVNTPNSIVGFRTST